MRGFIEHWNAAGEAERRKKENIVAAEKLGERINTGLIALRAARRTLGDRWMIADQIHDYATTNALDKEITFVKQRIDQLEYWKMILEKEAATVNVPQVEKIIEEYLSAAPPPAEQRAA